MKKFLNRTTYGVLPLILLIVSCETFLDEKADQKLAVPTTLNDFQALLDDIGVMGSCPNEGEISTTDYYLTEADINDLSESERRMYVWNPDVPHVDRLSSGWSMSYREIYHCNLVLEGLEKMQVTNLSRDDWSNIKGQALLFRGSSFLNLAGVWTLAYNKKTAQSDLGLPLRLSTDFNLVSKRSSLEETYSQIVEDIKTALLLLPERSLSIFRPSKAAAFGYLARAYLSMGEYESAYRYADSCLQLHPDLMDYNDLSLTANYPFRPFTDNREIIFYRSYSPDMVLAGSRAKINPELFASYDERDLRKAAFFRLNTDDITYRFKGSYHGGSTPFGGIASDEIYLIRAECLVRIGRVEEGLSDLNRLLVNRWLTIDGISTFKPISSFSAEEALNIILKERRKELVMRALRWVDVKRINNEDGDITLTRKVGEQTYILPPNDLRFALPIPEDVIMISGMQQNRR